ncbi:MAG TPA: BBP7 family outer membrane beta-barrel protein, partial [Acidimicrobiales bacterium]|nr:BBP7 family outer membrane beta-barrel protein [Acidimicrobiales bacterium]
AGYTVLYWSSVVRPGDQVDLLVNASQIPSNLLPTGLVGPARPAVLFRDTDFWAQGVNLSLEVRY